MSGQEDGGDQTADGSPDVDHCRRAAIAKMGAIAAPVFVMLLTADTSEAWSASGRKPPKPPKPPKPKGL